MVGIDRVVMVTDMEEIDYLRSRLVPAGIPLSEVRPEQQGLKWHEYLAVHWADMRAEAHRLSAANHAPVRAVSTARDRYGWRSLPPGTHMLPKPKPLV